MATERELEALRDWQARRRGYIAKGRAKRRARGKCWHCPTAVEPGMTLCDHHMEYNRLQHEKARFL